MSKYSLAQVNIALAKADLSSPVMEGFVSRLAEINSLAEKARGFIWRLKAESGTATSIHAFENPLIIVNLSVWENIEALQSYVYKSVHLELLKGKKSWFEKPNKAHQALWWVPFGHIPTVEEAKIKLESIQEYGSTKDAFSFAKSYPEPQT